MTLTPREAMYLAAKSVADVEMLDTLTVLAVKRCTGERGKCQQQLAWLYDTRLGPVLVAVVPAEDHVLAAIDDPRARREFADSRDQRLGARSEWDVVDHVLADHDGWHPAIPAVVCAKHGLVDFDRDTFVRDGRRRGARTLDL